MLVWVWWGNVQSYPQSMATRCRWARFLGVYSFSCQKTANEMGSCSNSSTYYHHNHGFIIRTRCFHNWQWEDINSWWLKNNFLPILSTSEYSKIVLGRGSSYDEEYNITHVHVELGFCRKCVLMKQHNFIRKASIIRESWHETIDGRSRFKLIPLPTKQKRIKWINSYFAKCAKCFSVSAPRSPRPDLRPEARFAPKQDVSSDAFSRRRVGGWCFSSDIAHNTTRFHNLCILWRIFKRTGMLEQFTETVHHLHFHREVTSFARKTSKCGLQVHVHASQYQLETPKIKGICFVHHNQWPSIPTTCYSHFLAISPRFWNSGSGSWQKGVVLECGTRATEMDSMDPLLVGWIGSCWMFFYTTLVTGSCPAGPFAVFEASHVSQQETLEHSEKQPFFNQCLELSACISSQFQVPTFEMFPRTHSSHFTAFVLRQVMEGNQLLSYNLDVGRLGSINM